MNKRLSKLVTPPDVVKGRAYSVVVVDPTLEEVDDLALFLQYSDRQFNVYLYRAEMNDEEWLNKVVEKSNTVIVNTVNTVCSEIKDRLVVNPKNFYYGQKKFMMNTNKIEKPIDFFVQFTLKEKNVSK